MTNKELRDLLKHCVTTQMTVAKEDMQKGQQNLVMPKGKKCFCVIDLS